MKNRIIIFCLIIIFGGSACTNAQVQDETKNPYYKPTETAKLKVADAEWKKILAPQVYEIMREKGTERANSGPFVHNVRKGKYHCAACGNPLFSSSTKFDSHTGWPSFYQALNKSSVSVAKDDSYGMVRDEVVCSRCGGHLGHVFDDGPEPTHLRYCMNGYALMFEVEK